jgi:hypothetical protein
MNRKPEKVVFLLGAGASADAGMPVVAALTRQLRQRLPKVNDIDGYRRKGFGDAFDCIAGVDPEVETNYEKFFEWIRVLLKVQEDPFRKGDSMRLWRLRHVNGELFG